MPVKSLTAEDVKQAFAAAIPTAQRFDQARWDDLYRRASEAGAPTWQAQSGIEVLPVVGARLVRVRWRFEIDKLNTSSDADLRSNAASLKQTLFAVINGQPTSFAEPEYNNRNAWRGALSAEVSRPASAFIRSQAG